MPLEGDEGEIREAGFELIGWVDNAHRDRSGLDEHDPINHRVGWSFPTPGADFAAQSGFGEFPKRQIFTRTDGVVVARAEVWSDEPQRDRDGEAYSTVNVSGSTVRSCSDICANAGRI